MFRGSNIQPIMKRAMTAIMLLTLAALLAACGTGGSSLGGVTTGTVSGTITDKDTDAPVTASVKIEIGGRETTTSTGAYSVSNVPTGHRELMASASGYNSVSRLVRVTSGATVANIQLERIEDPDNILSGTVIGPQASLTAQLPNSMWNQLMAFVSPVALAQVSGEAPVVGATVQAFNWDTGEAVGESAITASDGSFTLIGVPHDITVLIRVVKGDLRLTYIVPNVQEGTEAHVDTHSTLVAEILGANFGQAPLDLDELDDVRDAVTDLLADLNIGDLDLRAMAGWLSDKFGGDVNLHERLRDIRSDLVTLADGGAHTQMLIGVLRNTWPTLIAYGTPIIGDVSGQINESVAPIFITVNERLATIAGLVADADLEWENLTDGHVFTFYDGEDASDSDYRLTTTVVGVDEADGAKTVDTEFEVARIDDDFVISEGEMSFTQREDEPVTWMDLVVTFVEEDDERITDLTVGAEIEFEWELDEELAFGDYRDLKQIVVSTREISSGGEDAEEMMNAFGTLTASMDVREWHDSKGRRIPMPTDLHFVGQIVLPGLDATLDVSHITFELEPVEGTYDRDTFSLDAEIDVWIGEDRDTAELRFGGHFEASGVHVSSEEGSSPGSWGESTSSFDGTISVNGRAPVSIQFNTDRSGQDEFEIGDDFTIVAEGVTFIGSGNVQVDRGEEIGAFNGAIIDLTLEDLDGYVIDVTITLEEGLNIDVVGDVTHDDFDGRLALITSEGFDVPTVIYDPDNTDEEEWITESLF